MALNPNLLNVVMIWCLALFFPVINAVKNMCVAGAVQNFTSQFSHYTEDTSDRRYNMAKTLVFLTHFVGDIHQPMHVGFRTDEGGNTIALRWYRNKSNLHHVWDREIIQQTMKDYYDRTHGKDFGKEFAVVPPRHIHKFRRWWLRKSCMHSEIILGSLRASDVTVIKQVVIQFFRPAGE